MKVSVCLATWSRKTKLMEIIELLEHQSFPRDEYEIIVVDSNSPDGTKQIMLKLCEIYNNIQYIENSENVLAIKRNIGIEHASGETIILMDDDVYPCRDFIISHYRANLNNFDTFYCGQIRFPGELCQSSNYYRFRDQQHLNKKDSGKDLPFNKIVVMNLSFKKEFIKQTGNIDERFIGYGCEDIEFGYRIIQNGYKIKYLDSALALHLDDCSDISSYGEKLYKSGLYGHRAMERMFPNIYSLLYDDKAIAGHILSCIILHNSLMWFLKKTDKYSYMYSYYIYKAYLYSCVFRGKKDQVRFPALEKKDTINGW